MSNPFAETSATVALDPADPADEQLVGRVLAGDRSALEQLVRRHQAWVYNLAVRMVGDPHDAEDVAQEVMIKVLSKLSTFRGESRFRTWLYRIVANHVLTMKRSRLERDEVTFARLGQRLDDMPDHDLPDPHAVPVDVGLLVEETRVRCTTGMLLCLDRRQRLVFVLGEMFGASDTVAAEVLELTPAHFRQLLHRARRDLYNFMQSKCGLVNAANRCRCAKKTRAMIDAGAVDPHNLRFTGEHVKKIADVAGDRAVRLAVLEERHAAIFRDHPFLAGRDHARWLRDLLATAEARRTLGL